MSSGQLLLQDGACKAAWWEGRGLLEKADREDDINSYWVSKVPLEATSLLNFLISASFPAGRVAMANPLSLCAGVSPALN